jgi:RNA recognition motif-containing protein
MIDEYDNGRDDILESTIYIGGLHNKVTIEMLYELFVTFGVIKHIDLPLDHKHAVDPEKLENPKE